LKRYGEKSFRHLFGISGKWLGLYVEVLLDSRALFRIFLDYGLILDKYRKFFVKLAEIISLDLFLNGQMYELGSRHVDHR
jgi:hypothetical protein